MSRRRRSALTAGGLALLTSWGCAVGDPPERPSGAAPYEVEDVVGLTEAPVVPQVQAARPLVVAALDDATSQPVGGRYDEGRLALAPLQQTYFFWALSPVLTHALHGGLERGGLRVYLDGLDLGLERPYPAPPYPAGLLALRGTVERFAYDRWGDRGRDVLVGELSLQLVDGATGELLWRGLERVEVSVPSEGEVDPFARFGQVLAAQLLEDGALRAVLEAPAEAAPVRASSPREEAR